MSNQIVFMKLTPPNYYFFKCTSFVQLIGWGALLTCTNHGLHCVHGQAACGLHIVTFILLALHIVVIGYFLKVHLSISGEHL